jgi:hypothetical protein
MRPNLRCRRCLGKCVGGRGLSYTQNQIPYCTRSETSYPKPHRPAMLIKVNCPLEHRSHTGLSPVVASEFRSNPAALRQVTLRPNGLLG